MSEYDDIIGTVDAQIENSHTSEKFSDVSRNGSSHRVTSAVLQNMSDVQSEPIRWLWPSRFALGKVSIIAGLPGLGKSFLTIDMAARVTTGNKWPDGSAGILGNVIMVSAEDDAADTIRPRLDSSGADVSRVSLLQGINVAPSEDKPGREKSFSLDTDVPVLEPVLMNDPDCRLIIIDPLSAYLGGTDSNNNGDIRGLLKPLAELAAKYKVAIVCVEHLNKRSGGSAIYRVQGSIGITGAARAVYAVSRDTDDPTNRMFVPVKNNLGDDRTGLSFKLIEQPGSMTPCLAWSDVPITKSADEILSDSDADKRKPTALDKASDWLEDYLSNGPQPATEVLDAGKDSGHSQRTLYRAKDELNIVSEKNGSEHWEWTLPTSANDNPTQQPWQTGNVGNLPPLPDDLPPPRLPKQQHCQDWSYREPNGNLDPEADLEEIF